MNFKEQIAKIIEKHEISLELLDEYEISTEQEDKINKIEQRLWEQ